ncbi:exodeoxyribonuclease V subunit beta [Thioalkalivibrio sp.]|uniref:exodeoxyribonuclease V subunit beta n=1 Tax=Thioalkalivibrio sp. TaxID=2093813 RepID=UPI003561DCD5
MNAPAGDAHTLTDPAALPLYGSRLIEASAGTGKTWTIAALYLRLVLGHGGEQAFREPLLPPQILVVTFTDAATRELRGRIHARLLDAARHFRGDAAGVPDAMLRGLLQACPDPGERAVCARRLELAAEWMDEAAVSTIHGWCFRMLREHAFDSGSLFEQQVEPDLSELRVEAVRDYWRCMVYPQQGPRLLLLRSILGNDPGVLDRRIRPLLGGESPRPAGLAELNDRLDRRLAWLERLKRPWRDDFDAVAESLRGALPELNGNQYRDPDARLEDMRAWALDPVLAVPGDPKKELARRFSREGMQARLRRGRSLPDALHPAFALLDGYADAADDTPEAVLRHAAAWVRHRLEAEQRRRAQLGFDDLLNALDAALHRSGGARLAETIRNQFPVAMIDEFQDTDPVQYRIFERIYRIGENRPEQGIFLIGDPKQSIYAFRGADIHSYLRARRDTAGRHHTLQVNYRASRAFVEACNRLFDFAGGHPGGAFLFRRADGGDPVPFERVQAAGQPESLRVDAAEPPALVLAQLDDAAPVATGAYVETMAERCASAMVSLLNRGRDGRAGFDGPDGFRPLQAADLAVLVRTRKEAAVIRRALRRRGVRSVFMSDRESVFATPEAADVLRWLRACAEPESDRLLRAALATATLDLGLEALDRLNHDEPHWEARVLEFREYRRVWREQGVLPMLRRVLHGFGLPAALFQRPDGERTLTNLLHLSELLQAASGELDGEQALIRHLAEHLQGEGVAADEQILRLESDEALVQVVTIHKAKGLQYPLVFLPFICGYRPEDGKSPPLVWHDAAGRRRVRWQPDDADVAEADRGRLAEDLRLLYVAVTRARHQCWLGIAPLRRGRGRGNELHRSAFGYLVAGGSEIPEGQLRASLLALAGGEPGIAVVSAPEATEAVYRPPAGAALPGPAREPLRAPREHWWIASYSALRAEAPPENGITAMEAPDTALEDRFAEAAEEVRMEGAGMEQQGTSSLHRFPRGPEPGTFLHGLLEWAAREGFAAVAAEPERLRDTVARRCRRRGWEHWVEPVTAWLGRLLDAPLDLPGTDEPLRLSRLAACQPELEFWFETRWVDARRIDGAVRAGTLEAAPRPEMEARILNGMLKGFIDLVFEHEGRYYTLDYKSNWLGPGAADYAAASLRERVLESRYDLQYVLYTLALHRLLQVRLPGYEYERHLGGTITWFLRGLDSPARGLHFERPPAGLIEELDRMVRAAPDRAEGVLR